MCAEHCWGLACLLSHYTMHVCGLCYDNDGDDTQDGNGDGYGGSGDVMLTLVVVIQRN